MQAVNGRSRSYRETKVLFFCRKNEWWRRYSDKLAPQSSMENYEPWISGPVRVSWTLVLGCCLRSPNMQSPNADLQDFWLLFPNTRSPNTGTSWQNSRDIPDSSLRNTRKTNFRGRARSFWPPPLRVEDPHPSSGLRTPNKLIFVLFFFTLHRRPSKEPICFFQESRIWAYFWEGDATKHFQWKRRGFQWKEGRPFSEWGVW